MGKQGELFEEKGSEEEVKAETVSEGEETKSELDPDDIPDFSGDDFATEDDTTTTEETQETKTEEGATEEGETAAEGEESKQEGTSEQQKSNYVPYTRFQEMVKERNAALEQLKNPPPPQQEGVKQNEEAAKDPDELSPEVLEALKGVNPALYDAYKEQQMAKKVAKTLEKQIAEKHKQEQAQKQVEGYIQYYQGKLDEDFKDLKDTESPWFQETKSRADTLKQEYPIITQDIGAAHLALRLIEAEKKLKNLGTIERQKAKEDVKTKTAAKKSATMAGQAKTLSKKNDDDDADFGGPPAWERK